MSEEEKQKKELRERMRQEYYFAIQEEGLYLITLMSTIFYYVEYWGVGRCIHAVMWSNYSLQKLLPRRD